MRIKNWNTSASNLTLILISALLCTWSLTACAKKVNPENPEYSFDRGQPLQFDTYCPYGETYLTTLKNTYDLEGLTADCETELEKAETIAKWVTNLWEHNGWNVPPKLFQIKYPLKEDEFTHSATRFYSLPQQKNGPLPESQSS